MKKRKKKNVNLTVIYFQLTLFILIGCISNTALFGQTPGDVNNNNVVDIVDALLVAQYYVGLAPSPFNTDTADVNCDNTINIVDALLVAQYYVGLIGEFPCGTAPTPEGTPMPPVAGGEPLYLTSGWKLEREPSVSASGQTISGPGFNDNSWLLATVPGTALISYLNQGKIPDPNFGENQREIDDTYYTVSYWYRCPFTVPQSYSGTKVWLNFDGICWKATVYLNGTLLGSINGAFIRGKFDITDIVTCGSTNYLAVFIKKHDHPGPLDFQDLSGPGVNGDELSRDTPTFLCSSGWDWIPTIRGRNVGIWNDVYLTSTGAVEIVDPYVIPENTSGDITIKADLRNNTSASQSGTLTGTIGSQTFSTNVSLGGSETRSITQTMRINNPGLWWPNGYGDQNLYTLTLNIEIGETTSDSKTVTFGIRTLSYDTSGHELYLSVNGTRIFCKGGNWGMPDSNLLCSEALYDTKIRLHKEMNFTMIRNWVGMTADKEFYEACDRYGILIFNDFWNNYWGSPDPDDPDMFLANARDYIKRRRNHPSLALWCGENEGTPPATINDGLQMAITELDGKREYFPNSIQGGIHGSGPYKYQQPRYYFENARGFTTELGTTCVPPIESMRKMMSENSLWPINDTWGMHDYCHGGNGETGPYEDAIEKYGGRPSGIEEFCKKAQLVNIENYKAMFEAWNNKLFNDCGGVLLWMSQSCWPSMVWQTYDYFFEPTGGYWGSRKACEPIHIQWNIHDESVKVINTSSNSWNNLTAEAGVYNMDGTERYNNSVTINSSPNTVTNCFTISFPGNLSAVHFIKLTLMNDSSLLSENFYWRGTSYLEYGELANMPTVNLTSSAGRSGNITTATITNTDSGIAFAIRLVLLNSAGERVLPVYYEDNYFSLLPGESKTVRIEGTGPSRLRIEGWNISMRELNL
jgi:hypothetical protein